MSPSLVVVQLPSEDVAARIFLFLLIFVSREREMQREMTGRRARPRSCIPMQFPLCSTATHRPAYVTTTKAKLVNCNLSPTRLEMQCIIKLPPIGTTCFFFPQCAGCVLLSEEPSVGIHVHTVYVIQYTQHALFVGSLQVLHACVRMSAASTVICSWKENIYQDSGQESTTP